MARHSVISVEENERLEALKVTEILRDSGRYRAFPGARNAVQPKNIFRAGRRRKPFVNEIQNVNTGSSYSYWQTEGADRKFPFSAVFDPLQRIVSSSVSSAPFALKPG
jgi:hypothetical protein